MAAKTEGEDTDAGEDGGTVAQEVPDAAPEPVVPQVAQFDPEAAAMSRHHRDFAGSGPGSNGGPGGLRRRVRRQNLWANDRAIPKMAGESAFGGNRGALRGVVCFIPKNTAHIRDVQSCDPVTSLYTDELNVPERNFTKGFPGIADRIEWFAIDYTGKFNVSRAWRVLRSAWFRTTARTSTSTRSRSSTATASTDPSSTMGLVTLPQGDHKIRVLYWQGHGDRLALQLFVTPPGHEPERLWGPKL